MKRACLITVICAALVIGCGQASVGQMEEGMRLQDLCYEEAAQDVPNPDRGFYRANDGMVVPVGEGDVAAPWLEVGAEPVSVAGTMVETRISHMYFDLRNFSNNAFVGPDVFYDETYEAPEDVSIASRDGDKAPYDYREHFDYWVAHEYATWKHGRSMPLSDAALSYIRNVLEQVREGEGVALVRFNYDGMGFSWISCAHPDDGEKDFLLCDVEPEKEVILGHIEQLTPIFAEYEDVIMAVDGGFFGPWGEMHSTSFGTDPEAYAWLLDALLAAVPPSRKILVHPGAFLSWYNARHDTSYTFADMDKIPAPKEGTDDARFGFFNDSYAFGTDEPGSIPDDWGSISEGLFWHRHPFGDYMDFDRGRVMTLIRTQGSLYGGEAQGDETPWNSFPFLGFEASYAGTTYLNADYDSEVHERWASFVYEKEAVEVDMDHVYETVTGDDHAVFDPVYDGKSGIEFLRDRLGYRLVLREVYAPEVVLPGGRLDVKGSIQNVGFGTVFNEKAATLILEAEDGAATSIPVDVDARAFVPFHDNRPDNKDAWVPFDFSVTLPELPEGSYEMYLRFADPKEQSAHKRGICFANAGDLWNPSLGANRIGSVRISGEE